MFRIRIWIHIILGLLDPDPLIRGVDSDLDPSIILLSASKNSKENLDSYGFVTSFDFLSFKNYVNVPSKSNKQKNFFFVGVLRSTTKIAGSGSESGYGSISQRHGSADPDPNPHQNVMDP